MPGFSLPPLMVAIQSAMKPPQRLDMQRRMATRCQADDDGYCEWKDCPQLRDSEPVTCPDCKETGQKQAKK